MKKKYTDLIKNIGLLTISNFGSKLLSFFLIPIYTYVLTTEEYGNFDVINVTISLLIPIFTLNISESALRFLLDKKNDEKEICTITFKVSIVSCIIFLIFAILNKFFNVIATFNEYLLYFILFYFVSLLYQTIQNITRGLDKIKNLAISGIMNSVFMLTLNIVFLVYLKIGLTGYFLANIIANFIAAIYLCFSTNIIEKLKLKNHNKLLKKEMIDYGKPLMLNSIGWWINNVSDRYIVTILCGVAANGVYSISYKIPSILSIVQTIFNQAWSITAVKNFDKNDKDGFFKNIYEYYNYIMVVCCSILIIFNRLIARLLYMKDFYSAWKYTPFLMISMVFGALSGLMGGVFSAVKDSKILGTTTIIGAIINIILNIILINKIGAIGAAIATAISYCVVFTIRLLTLKKYIKLDINLKKDIVVYVLLVIQTIICYYIVDNYVLLYLIQIIIFIFICMLYRKLIMELYNKIKCKIKGF